MNEIKNVYSVGVGSSGWLFDKHNLFFSNSSKPIPVLVDDVCGNSLILKLIDGSLNREFVIADAISLEIRDEILSNHYVVTFDLDKFAEQLCLSKEKSYKNTQHNIFNKEFSNFTSSKTFPP